MRDIPLEQFRKEIEVAHRRISPYIRKTPVLELARGSFGLDVPLFLKLESLQHSGSFKVRGAFNRILAGVLPESGVIAASGGNHGAAVALAAATLSCRAEIFVPRICSESKLSRLRQLNAELTVSGDCYADALELSRARAAQTGALEIHAYDQQEVVAGQGTVGKEIEEQVRGVETVIVAVGGGGLIGGICGWFEGRVRGIGVEPALAPTLCSARKAGRPVDVEVSGVAADSLGARRAGELPFLLTQSYADSVLLLDEADIIKARQLLWKELRLLVEPAAALPLAALLCGAYHPRPDEKICLVICGANTTLAV